VTPVLDAVQPAPPLPEWATELNLLQHPDQRVRLYLPDGQEHWVSNAGPQTWLQVCPCDEICFGGRRGGGKSIGLIAWMISGDPTLPEDDPARTSFLNDPDFRGLFLRERYQDMRDFIEEAVEFFRPFGVRPVDNPAILTFPGTNAKIYTDHLGNEEAYNKYRGWNITRIGIEELTRIPKLKQYVRLFGSLRSKQRIRDGKVFPKLRTQIASTTNPDGPGASWCSQRFVDVYAGGQLVPWNTPMQDPITKLWRIFIPAGLRDNPYLANNAEYWGMLMSQDPVTRAQWIEGDWHASGGAFFRDYRPFGPIGEQEQTEFPWARHLIEPVELKPWWYRWGSGDWGYDHPAAFHKFCRNDHDKRVHVYDELMLRKVGSFEMGTLLAKWWAPELDDLPEHQVTIYLSPDAFSKIDEPKTRAEQIEAGIKSVLGPYGGFILHYNEEERQLAARDEKAASIAFEIRRKQQAGRVCIIIQKANSHDRVARFAYVRDLLRFRPLVADTKPDAEYLTALFARKGQAAYEAEVAKYAQRKPEILPMLQIWRVCRELDRCMREAVHNEGPKHEEPLKMDAEDGVGGDDSLDSFSYGAFAFREIQNQMPRAHWVAERMEEAQAKAPEPITDVNRLMQIQRQQEALYAKQHPPKGGTYTPPRAGSPWHRK
jgi:hypothetical protein